MELLCQCLYWWRMFLPACFWVGWECSGWGGLHGFCPRRKQLCDLSSPSRAQAHSDSTFYPFTFCFICLSIPFSGKEENIRVLAFPVFSCFAFIHNTCAQTCTHVYKWTHVYICGKEKCPQSHGFAVSIAWSDTAGFGVSPVPWAPAHISRVLSRTELPQIPQWGIIASKSSSVGVNTHCSASKDGHDVV